MCFRTKGRLLHRRHAEREFGEGSEPAAKPTARVPLAPTPPALPTVPNPSHRVVRPFHQVC